MDGFMSRETKTFFLPGSTSANTTVNVSKLRRCGVVDRKRGGRFKIVPESLRRRENEEKIENQDSARENRVRG